MKLEQKNPIERPSELKNFIVLSYFCSVVPMQGNKRKQDALRTGM